MQGHDLGPGGADVGRERGRIGKVVSQVFLIYCNGLAGRVHPAQMGRDGEARAQRECGAEKRGAAHAKEPEEDGDRKKGCGGLWPEHRETVARPV